MTGKFPGSSVHKLKLKNKTALDRGRTDRTSLTHDLDLNYDLDLQSPASYVHDLLTRKILR